MESQCRSHVSLLLYYDGYYDCASHVPGPQPWSGLHSVPKDGADFFVLIDRQREMDT